MYVQLKNDIEWSNKFVTERKLRQMYVNKKENEEY